MNINAVNITEVSKAPKLWQEIIDSSHDGWIWHTWLAHEFNLCAGEKFKAEDHSFFVYENDKAVGIVPLIIQEKIIGDFKGREATYYSGFLPWPCFRAGFESEHAAALESFAFTELEQRARNAGVGRISIRMTPPMNRGDELKRVTRATGEHSYLYIPLSSHIVMVLSLIHI